MKEKLQVYALLAEIIGGVAIVLSLLYVAYEYRRSETISSRDVENILYERVVERNRLVIENPGFAKVLVKSSKDSHLLSDEELVQLAAYEHIFYDSWEEGYSHSLVFWGIGRCRLMAGISKIP